MEHRQARGYRTAREIVASSFARRDDRVETVEWHTKAAKLVFEILCGPGRVRQKHDPPMPVAKMFQGVASGGEGSCAIVQNAPDVADQRIIFGRDVGEMREKSRLFVHVLAVA